MPLWTAPKTNWITTDGIGYADLNRSEQNTQDLRDAIYRRVQGFGYVSDIGAAYIKILPGSCFSEDYYPLKFASGGIKNFTAHSIGFGTGYGGMAPGVTIAADTWYYVFALGHATSSAVEIMIDSSPTGANVTLANYPYKRYVNCFKTDSASQLSEMYSTGNDVFINPNAMYNARDIQFANSVGIENLYQTITLQSGAEGLALPAREVLARLNVRADDDMYSYGFISRVAGATTGLAFTIPTNLLSGGTYYAEVLATLVTSGGHGLNLDFDIMVNSSSQLSLAMRGVSSPYGNLYVAVRGFTDTREI